jgi:hypothetical protein
MAILLPSFPKLHVARLLLKLGIKYPKLDSVPQCAILVCFRFISYVPGFHLVPDGIELSFPHFFPMMLNTFPLETGFYKGYIRHRAAVS